ncbi:hypothetical protein [Kitasatospora sp. NPDC091207]|uniref:ATP-binding protein n=1 Tax=Kitasatospora sp. NPDC091207 TaxID=3364083 RepID=UPI0038084D55
MTQEALTNAAKHAPHAPVTVRVAHSPEGARVEVVNGPSPVGPPVAPVGAGRGLIGLAERVRLAGGTLRHGPRGDGGGFEVVAFLPRSSSTAVAAPGPVPVSPARELSRARRRVGRMMAATVLVPLVTVLVLTAVLRGWVIYSAGRAVLDPADYASLRVGQDRATAQPFLPAHQFPYHPSVGNPPPRGEGVTCEYYAITAAPFNDDRSGDAYRLCFREGVLVSLDALVA